MRSVSQPYTAAEKAQVLELNHQLKEKKELIETADYMLTKGELTRTECDAVKERIARDYAAIVKEIGVIHKRK